VKEHTAIKLALDVISTGVFPKERDHDPWKCGNVEPFVRLKSAEVFPLNGGGKNCWFNSLIQAISTIEAVRSYALSSTAQWSTYDRRFFESVGRGYSFTYDGPLHSDTLSSTPAFITPVAFLIRELNNKSSMFRELVVGFALLRLIGCKLHKQPETLNLEQITVALADNVLDEKTADQNGWQDPSDAVSSMLQYITSVMSTWPCQDEVCSSFCRNKLTTIEFHKLSTSAKATTLHCLNLDGPALAEVSGASPSFVDLESFINRIIFNNAAAVNHLQKTFRFMATLPDVLVISIPKQPANSTQAASALVGYCYNFKSLQIGPTFDGLYGYYSLIARVQYRPGHFTCQCLRGEYDNESFISISDEHTDSIARAESRSVPVQDKPCSFRPGDAALVAKFATKNAALDPNQTHEIVDYTSSVLFFQRRKFMAEYDE
jgi:hypothetical protein